MFLIIFIFLWNSTFSKIFLNFTTSPVPPLVNCQIGDTYTANKFNGVEIDFMMFRFSS